MGLFEKLKTDKLTSFDWDKSQKHDSNQENLPVDSMNHLLYEISVIVMLIQEYGQLIYHYKYRELQKMLLE